MMESPDQVCARYSEKGIKVTLRIDDGVIYIEGNKNDLEFLSALLKAQANYLYDTGFEISPLGPGSVFFSRDSTHGVYIHRKD